MRRFSLVAVSFIFAAIFAVSAMAQAPAQPAAGSGKIGLIKTSAFDDEKGGISKYRTAITSLEGEFKPINDQLQQKVTRYQTLGKEIQDAQKANPAVPVNQSAIQAKVDEFQSLETEIKRMQEDGKAKYEKRYAAVVGPIFNDIIKALNDFAKQKGYAVILDGAKLEEAQILLGFDDKYDVTKDFITFYNSRPAGTATTATPVK
jgi:Skp family chaperone for outer membrane proteins